MLRGYHDLNTVIVHNPSLPMLAHPQALPKLPPAYHSSIMYETERYFVRSRTIHQGNPAPKLNKQQSGFLNGSGNDDFFRFLPQEQQIMNTKNKNNRRHNPSKNNDYNTMPEKATYISKVDNHSAKNMSNGNNTGQIFGSMVGNKKQNIVAIPSNNIFQYTDKVSKNYDDDIYDVHSIESSTLGNNNEYYYNDDDDDDDNYDDDLNLNSGGSSSTLAYLIAPLFLAATTLLLISLLYTLFFVCILRHGIHDPETRRIFLFRSSASSRICGFNICCCIPMGFFVYLYGRNSQHVFALEGSERRLPGRGVASDSGGEGFTREERRAAMKRLLEEWCFIGIYHPSDIPKEKNTSRITINSIEAKTALAAEKSSEKQQQDQLITSPTSPLLSTRSGTDSVKSNTSRISLHNIKTCASSTFSCIHDESTFPRSLPLDCVLILNNENRKHNSLNVNTMAPLPNTVVGSSINNSIPRAAATSTADITLGSSIDLKSPNCIRSSPKAAKKNYQIPSSSSLSSSSSSSSSSHSLLSCASMAAFPSAANAQTPNLCHVDDKDHPSCAISPPVSKDLESNVLTKKQVSILSKTMSSIDVSARSRLQRQNSILSISSISRSVLRATEKAAINNVYEDNDLENGKFAFLHSAHPVVKKDTKASVYVQSNNGKGSIIKTNSNVISCNDEDKRNLKEQIGLTNYLLQQHEKEKELSQNHIRRNIHSNNNFLHTNIASDGDKEENASGTVDGVSNTSNNALSSPLSSSCKQPLPQNSKCATSTMSQVQVLQKVHQEHQYNQAQEHLIQKQNNKTEAICDTVNGRTICPEATNLKKNNNLDFWMDIDDNIPTCSICIEEYTGTDHCYLNKTICNHQFHIDCLLDWFEQSFNELGSSSFHCPCCRREITVLSKDKIIDMARLMRREILSNRTLLMEGNVEYISTEDEESRLSFDTSTSRNTTANFNNASNTTLSIPNSQNHSNNSGDDSNVISTTALSSSSMRERIENNREGYHNNDRRQSRRRRTLPSLKQLCENFSFRNRDDHHTLSFRNESQITRQRDYIAIPSSNSSHSLSNDSHVSHVSSHNDNDSLARNDSFGDRSCNDSVEGNVVYNVVGNMVYFSLETCDSSSEDDQEDENIVGDEHNNNNTSFAYRQQQHLVSSSISGYVECNIDRVKQSNADATDASNVTTSSLCRQNADNDEDDYKNADGVIRSTDNSAIATNFKAAKSSSSSLYCTSDNEDDNVCTIEHHLCPSSNKKEVAPSFTAPVTKSVPDSLPHPTSVNSICF